MERNKMQEPVEIDLDDPNMMAWVNEMRNSQPSEAERRKTSNYRYYLRHKEERAEANRKWGETHAEHYAENQNPEEKTRSGPRTLPQRPRMARGNAR